jgi:hypothetical protein
MNLINFRYAVSLEHFTNSYNEATGMYACACMFAHLYCLRDEGGNCSDRICIYSWEC